MSIAWTVRRLNKSVLQEISPDYSLEGRTDAEAESANSLEKILMLVKIEGMRRK